MAEILLHSLTQANIRQIIRNPPHALLICGPAGSGKQTVAEHIAASLLQINSEKLVDYPYYSLIEKPNNKQEISIDTVRSIISKLKLKPAAAVSTPVKQVILIDGAQLLSAEAQNALLKVIEEPPPATIFILTALSDSSVLPTIASRAQKLTVNPVDSAKVLNYFENQYKPEAIKSAWALSGGSSGLLTALLRDSGDHPLKQAVESAKKFISLKPYDRILFLDSLSADKAAFRDFLDALGRILSVLHKSAIESGNLAMSKKLIAARKLVNNASKGLDNNASGRLTMLELVMRLPI